MPPPEPVYLLCFLTSFICAALLARAYARTRSRILLWTALSFCFLAVNNALVVSDLILFPEINLWPYRQAAAVAAVSVLLFGFIWEAT